MPGVRIVLRTDWNPIGFGVPLDEYDCVTGTLAHLLRDGATPGQIAVALGEHRTGHLGLEPDPVGDRRAAQALVAWYRTAIGEGNAGRGSGSARADA
jgi:hypothetical protein